jgi:hypothetical protein
LLRNFFDGNDIFPSLAGTLIFAVHPVHVESISWISGCIDLLLTLFLLGAFLSYVRYRKNQQLKYFVFAVLLFSISLFIKEVAVVFPLLILGYDLANNKRADVPHVGIFFILSGAYLALRTIVLGRAVGMLEFSWAGLKYFGAFIAAYVNIIRAVAWVFILRFPTAA